MHILKNKLMHINKLLLGLLIITLLSSCATQKLTEEGNTAYTAGDYTTALAAWDQIIEKQESKGQKAEAKVYYKAGLAAHKLDQTKKASDYLRQPNTWNFTRPNFMHRWPASIKPSTICPKKLKPWKIIIRNIRRANELIRLPFVCLKLMWKVKTGKKR